MSVFEIQVSTFGVFLVRILNTDKKNSEYGDFLRSEKCDKYNLFLEVEVNLKDVALTYTLIFKNWMMIMSY